MVATLSPPLCCMAASELQSQPSYVRCASSYGRNQQSAGIHATPNGHYTLLVPTSHCTAVRNRLATGPLFVASYLPRYDAADVVAVWFRTITHLGNV